MWIAYNEEFNIRQTNGGICLFTTGQTYLKTEKRCCWNAAMQCASVCCCKSPNKFATSRMVFVVIENNWGTEELKNLTSWCSHFMYPAILRFYVFFKIVVRLNIPTIKKREILRKTGSWWFNTRKQRMGFLVYWFELTLLFSSHMIVAWFLQPITITINNVW